jgi:hypothetical protein
MNLGLFCLETFCPGRTLEAVVKSEVEAGIQLKDLNIIIIKWPFLSRPSTATTAFSKILPIPVHTQSLVTC